jgi:hypothetical protein
MEEASKGEAVEHGAKALGVSPRYVYDAQIIIAKAPEFAEQMKTELVAIAHR